VTVGLHTTNLANKLLDTISNTSFAAGATTAVKLHTGDPGAAAATSASSVTTRPTLAWNAAASGSKSISNTPSWSNWAGTNGEVVSHMSVWDATTAGNPLYTFALTVSKTMNTGDTLNLTSHSISLSPLAA
jgi:hypothetical protein